MTMKLLLKTAAVTMGLIGAFGSADAGEANGGRRVFSSLLRVGELVAEAGAHGVDPSIGLGVMFCSSGGNGLDAARWARTLRAHGKGGTVRWCPGGGCWTDHSFDELVDKAYCMAAQVRDLPSDVTAVQAEIENFPYQSLRKSPSFTMFEALFDEAICCTGVAWDFAGFSSRDREEFKPFFEAVRRAMPALREVSEAFGRMPCSGVSFPWDGHSGTVPGRT